MSPTAHQLISLDLPPLLAACFVAVSCAVLGNYLVLRRLSLMGDAISHAVLPGIVVAFLVFDSRAPQSMFVGALCAGLLTVALVSLIQRFTRVESSASIGVVFSVLFALGVLLLEQAAARHVDLDADCVLMGQLETLWWSPPASWEGLFARATLATFPGHVVSMGVVAVLTLAFVGVFYKELRIAAFDPALATSLGISATLMHALLMGFVAIAAVSAFEAVGSILVVAMLICPAATARLLTDRMASQLAASVGVALLAAIGGYVLATRAPAIFGTTDALSAAGMIAVVSGVLLTVAILVAPRHGVVARHVRRLALSVRIAREDLLAALYRLEEMGAAPGEAPGEAGRLEMIGAILRRDDLAARVARRRARARGEVSGRGSDLALAPAGRALASSIIRSHRLWETYLVEEVGLRPDHVHETAMRLEHATTHRGERIAPEVEAALDPHGRAIPPDPIPPDRG